MFHRHSIRCIFNIRCNGHHFQETVITAVTILELFSEIHQLRNGLSKIIDIQKKCHKVCSA